MVNILVIDDDPDIGIMIQMLLEYKGYAVTLLEKTDEALSILQNNPIDLIIMDMLLSGTNGIDICAGFKKDRTVSHIPVLMLSAHPDAKIKCLEAGADDFIFKPFDLEDLLEKVSTLTSKNF